jgi:hypothetical protein
MHLHVQRPDSSPSHDRANTPPEPCFSRKRRSAWFTRSTPMDSVSAYIAKGPWGRRGTARWPEATGQQRVCAARDFIAEPDKRSAE